MLYLKRCVVSFIILCVGLISNIPLTLCVHSVVYLFYSRVTNSSLRVMTLEKVSNSKNYKNNINLELVTRFVTSLHVTRFCHSRIMERYIALYIFKFKQTLPNVDIDTSESSSTINTYSSNASSPPQRDRPYAKDGQPRSTLKDKENKSLGEVLLYIYFSYAFTFSYYIYLYIITLKTEKLSFSSHSNLSSAVLESTWSVKQLLAYLHKDNQILVVLFFSGVTLGYLHL